MSRPTIDLSLNERIGERIRRSRHAAGLSLSDLAEKTGVYSRQRLFNWETGKNRPSLEGAVAIGSVLGVKPSWLLFLEDKP